MTEPAAQPEPRPSHPPVWLVEGLDIVEHRRGVLLGVIGLVVAVGIALTLVVPAVVPPVPIVGAAVAVAAILLGLAAAVAADTTDLTVRGPRHVGAAGGELVAVLPSSPDPDAATELAAAVSEAREPGSPLLLGLAAAGRDSRPTAAWTDALAIALVRTGVSVLRIDLASGRSRPPGLVEVVRDGVKLTDAVSFEPGLRLARLDAGDDHGAALEALATIPERLPKDLDVLLVALPTAASRAVVTAVRPLDHVLIVAQRDRTSRVDLIAGLDALEAAGTQAQVALLDDRTSLRLGLVAPPDEASSADAEPRVAGPAAEPVPPSRSQSDAMPPPDTLARLDLPPPQADEASPDETAARPDHETGETESQDPPVLETEAEAGDEDRAKEIPEFVSPELAAEETLEVVEPLPAAQEPEPPPVVEPLPAAEEPDPPPVVDPGGSGPDGPDDDPHGGPGARDGAGGRAALAPRDVEVMLGAREAAAIALAEAQAAAAVGPGDEAATARTAGGVETAEVTEAAAPTETGRIVDGGDATAAGASAELDEGADSDEGEDTDEMPAMRPAPIRAAESDRDELLRTTAQLAHLLHDVDVRPEDHAADRSEGSRQQ